LGIQGYQKFFSFWTKTDCTFCRSISWKR